MNNDLKKVLMVGFLIITLVASVYGANRWFRRGSSSCANGQCSVVDVVPEPTPVVIPMPDNVVLDNTIKNKAQEGLTTDDLLGPPDSCDCKTCKCKECVCKDCKCEKCPGKKAEPHKDNKVKADTLPDPIDVETVETVKPQQTQYEYYESVPRRRGFFRRVFGR